MANRQVFIDELMKGFDQICPGHKCAAIYVPWLKSMSDKEFQALMSDIESDKYVIPLIIPNLGKSRLNVARNLKVGKSWGYEFFERIWITDSADPTVQYLSNKKYLIGEIPVRRQSQTSEAGLSTPMDNSHVDELSGAVTGLSKSSAMTAPEIQVLGNEGLYSTLEEFLSPRGGNAAAYQLMEQEIIDTGTGSLATARKSGQRVKSVEVAGILLKAAHLGNSI
jgi:hypothetical protein